MTTLTEVAAKDMPHALKIADSMTVTATFGNRIQNHRATTSI
jgi:hypothetical protein